MGLQDLYNTPEVQKFLNCLQSKDVYADKMIYQAGCLWKAS